MMIISHRKWRKNSSQEKRKKNKTELGCLNSGRMVLQVSNPILFLGYEKLPLLQVISHSNLFLSTMEMFGDKLTQDT